VSANRRQAASKVLLMDEFYKPRLELLAKLAEQLASLQRKCSELRRELDEHIKVQQEQWTQLAALKAKYDQLCRERDDFRKALEEQLRLNPAFCVMSDPNTEH
jgi:predicted phage-related endonuclease